MNCLVNSVNERDLSLLTSNTNSTDKKSWVGGRGVSNHISLFLIQFVEVWGVFEIGLNQFQMRPHESLLVEFW